AAPVLVPQIEVVLPDEAGVDLDAVATAGGRVANRNARVLAALQDDRDTKARAEALIEGFDPVFATHALRRLHDLHALGCGQTRDKAVIVLRDRAEVGLGNRRHLTAFVQEADDSGRLLHGLNDGVEQHTIEARVLK